MVLESLGIPLQVKIKFWFLFYTMYGNKSQMQSW